MARINIIFFGNRMDQLVAPGIRISMQIVQHLIYRRQRHRRRAERIFIGSQFDGMIDPVFPLNLLNRFAGDIRLDRF